MRRVYHILCLFFVFCFSSTVSLVASIYEDETIIKEKARIMRLYKNKRYAKAQSCIEQILHRVYDHEGCLELQFCQAYCNFYRKHYKISSKQFSNFIKEYPYSSKVEEALFMKGYSLSFIGLEPYLDQKDTYEAVRCLERYLLHYPKGNYVGKATKMLQNLNLCLMKKSFEEARLYLRLGYYNAAIVVLKNFEHDYPNSLFQEQVLLLLIESYKNLAIVVSNEKEKKEALEWQRHYIEILNSYKKTIK